jgi:putative oxidoreductase
MQRWLSPLLSHWSTPLGVPPGSLQRALMGLALLLRLYASGVTGFLLGLIGLKDLGFISNIGYLPYGYDKLFGGNTQFGMDAAFFKAVGMPMPELVGPMVGVLELGGALALLVGLFTRVFGLMLAGNMVVALITVNDYPAELPLFVACAALVWLGGGLLSVDQLIDQRMAGMNNPTSVVSRL